MQDARRYATRFAVAWPASFALLLAMYYPVASIPFAHHDQYRYFDACGPGVAEQKENPHRDPQYKWLKLIGRPIGAELEHQIFKRVNTIEDLTAVRIIGVGLFAVAMALLVCYLLELQLGPGVAFCIAACVFALPAVQFSVYMSSYNHPVAQILALLAALMMRMGSRVSACSPRWYVSLPRIGCHGVAVALLVTAQLSYAPSAFVALFPIGAQLALQGTAGWRATRGQMVRDVFLIGLGCLIYFAIIKHYYVSHGGHTIDGYKIQLNRDLLTRLQMALPLVWPALNLWNVHVSARLAYVVGAVLLSGWGLMLAWNLRCGRSAVWAAVQWTAGVAAVVLVSETTFFAAPSSWALYRTHFASAGLIVLLLAGAIAAWGHLVPARFRGRSAQVVACGALLVAGFWAHDNVLMNCLNDRLEFSYVCSQIAAHADRPIRRIHVVRPKAITIAFNGRQMVPSGDEFNVATTTTPSLNFLVRAALQKVFRCESLGSCDLPNTAEGLQLADSRAIAVTWSQPGEPIVSSPDTVVINMEPLLRVAGPPRGDWQCPPPLVARTPDAASTTSGVLKTGTAAR